MRKRSQPDSIDPRNGPTHPTKRFKPDGQRGNPTCCLFGAKYNRAWKNILPLLPLADWMSLAKVDPLLGHIIADNMAEITIDEEFVDVHPIPEYPDLYKTLGSLAKRLIVSSVPRGEDISAVLSYFNNNLQSLTLIDIVRPIAKCNYPGSLNSLTLIHCTIPFETMSSWLTVLGSTLESLHIDRCTFIDRPRAFQWVELPKLRHVVMKGEDNWNEFWRFTESTPIESLVFQLGDFPTQKMFMFPSLKSLEIRIDSLVYYSHGPRNVQFTLEHYSLEVTKWKEELFSVIERATVQFLWPSKLTLRSLSLPGCPVSTAWLKAFINLKELTIHAPLETKEEGEIMKAFHLQCPKVNINFSTDPNPTFNQILRLDEDSLVQIFSLLSKRDLLQLLPVHSRFKIPVQRSAKKLWTKHVCHPIRGAELIPMDRYMTVYEAIGGCINHVTIRVKNEGEFWRLLSCFPNIKSMTLGTKLKNEMNIQKFPPLTELTMKSNKISASYLRMLFTHLNSSLTDLSVCTDQKLNPVTNLTNLQSLAVPTSVVSQQLITVLKSNPKCTDLTVDFLPETKEIWKVWKILPRLPPVKRLHIIYHDETPNEMDINDLMRNIEELRFTMESACEAHIMWLLMKLGPQLKRLTILEKGGWPSSYVARLDPADVNLLETLPRLEELTTNLRCHHLHSSKLKTLTLAVQSRPMIIRHIKYLPALKEFNTANRLDVDDSFQREIEAALGERRTLRFNGVSYPVPRELREDQDGM